MLAALSRRITNGLIGATILLLDILTGPFLQFPVLFVLPVSIAAWFCSSRCGYILAVALPIGRVLIAIFLEHPHPVPFVIANAAIRIAVLIFIAYLVARTSRQTKELQARVESLVTICAWSRTVEYQGEWISFEQYLLRRFKINTSHGISPEEAQKAFGELKKNDRNA